MSIEGPEPSPKVIGYHAVIEVGLQTLITVVMKALDGCFFDRLVHPFHLTAGPWVTEFCQTVFLADNAILQSAFTTIHVTANFIVWSMALLP